MKQVSFGPPETPLFGLLHSPPPEEQGEFGIVITQPFANEYYRSYRSLKVLADRIAALGFFVLRFDYYGTGDSGGDDEDLGLPRWREDLLASIEFLRQETGVKKTHLIGRRLGGAICMEVASTVSGIERIALWDPVLNGKDYITELQEDHKDFVNVHHRDKWTIPEFKNDMYRFEALGQCFPNTLVDEIEAIQMNPTLKLGGVKICFIDSTPDKRQEPKIKDIERAGAKVDFFNILDSKTKDPLNPIRVYLPNPILRAISTWFDPNA